MRTKQILYFGFLGLLFLLAPCLSLHGQTMTVTGVGKVNVQLRDEATNTNASIILSPDEAKALKVGDKKTATLTADAKGNWTVTGQNAVGDPKDLKVQIVLNSDVGNRTLVVTLAESITTYKMYSTFTQDLK